MTSNTFSDNMQHLLEVLEEIREYCPRHRYVGAKCNLYTWCENILVPFETIEADPTSIVEYHDQPAWEWMPMSGTRFLTTHGSTKRAHYYMLGVLTVAKTEARLIIAELSEEGVEPSSMRHSKPVTVDVNDETRSFIMDRDGEYVS
ncbi:MAG: hypothetical protein R6V19_06520 [Armatimonadota bacterium]